MSERIPDLVVEQLALGELDEAEARRVRQQLEASGDSRLVTIEADDRQILADYPADQIARKIQRRLAAGAEAPARDGVRWMWIPVTAAIAAAAVVLILRPDGARAPIVRRSLDGSTVAQLQRPSSTELEPTRLKGDPRLTIKRRRPGGVETVESGSKVAQGDELQLSYVAGGAAHGVIVSADGAGAVTLHFPATPDGSTALSDRGLVALEHSYQLDDAPQFERFWMVTALGPIDVQRVLGAARAVAMGSRPDQEALSLPPDYASKSLLLLK